MTWKEIKEKIEAEGIKDEEEIEYIEVHSSYEEFHVDRSQDGKIQIWN